VLRTHAEYFFFENPENGVVSDTKSEFDRQTDGRTEGQFLHVTCYLVPPKKA